MRQTVVGVFDRYAQAQRAAQQLRDSGFGDSVFVTDDTGSSGDARSASASAGAASPARREDEDMFDKVRHFFSDLFANDDGDDARREVGTYAEAVRRGGAVVKVEVSADTEADAARQALVQAGAIDLEERASAWRAEGWTDLGTDTAGTAGSGGTDRQMLSSGGMSTPASASTQAINSGSGTAGSTLPMAGESAASTPPPSDSVRGEEDVIPVVREDLVVGKRTVSTGGVRVYARTVETPVSESVQLRSEHAVVDRQPVDRAVEAADLDALGALGERTIEVRETAEQPVVAKEARVIEEVRVGKTVEQRTEEIRDTVRNTEVEVEPLSRDAGSPTAATATDMSAGSGSGTGLGAESAMPASAATNEEEDFRSHFGSYYGDGSRYEDYAPAYRYGSTMRSDSRYSARHWDEVEPELRSNWETSNPGESNGWERFKAAVRHGWDRMTS